MASNSGENIRTLCRFRPLNSRELALQNQGTAHAMTFDDSGRSVWLGPDKGAGNYTLDAMLPPSATQQEARLRTVSDRHPQSATPKLSRRSSASEPTGPTWTR